MPAAVYGKELTISAPKSVTIVPPPPKDPPPPIQVISQSYQKDVEEPLPGQATAVSAEKKNQPQRPGLDLVEPSQAEISERKKLLKRLVNTRVSRALRLLGKSLAINKFDFVMTIGMLRLWPLQRASQAPRRTRNSKTARSWPPKQMWKLRA